MQTRIALIAIIVKDIKASTKVNNILHEYGDYIIGRFGLPYRKKDVNIISVAIDAPQDKIAAISGKIGMIDNVCAKTLYSDC